MEYNKEMNQGIQNNDFKYILQDTGAIYLGARFCYEELLEQEMVPFKLKAVITQYILKDIDASTSLESHFYYMTEDTFSYKTYKELKVKIKVSVPEEKRSLMGKKICSFKERVYTLKEFSELNLAQKKIAGIIVGEISISKLGLMSFTI